MTKCEANSLVHNSPVLEALGFAAEQAEAMIQIVDRLEKNLALVLAAESPATPCNPAPAPDWMGGSELTRRIFEYSTSVRIARERLEALNYRLTL